MQQFYFSPLVDINDHFTTPLGVDKDHPFASADIGKAVKLGATDTYIVCADGDEIEGTVEAIDAAKIRGGFSFGTVNKRGRRLAKVTSGTVTQGALVVAHTQAALGTANDSNMVNVKSGAPTLHKWRVISLRGGAGALNSTVTIERVNA